jgi:hypothetical protein
LNSQVQTSLGPIYLCLVSNAKFNTSNWIVQVL